jgi:hypothetical protein
VHTAKIAAALWVATVLVFGAGILRELYLSQYGSNGPLGALRLLDLNGELTVPAWYSSMLMWTAAGLLALHAIISGKSGLKARWYWWALAAILAYLSLDETSEIHEFAGDMLLPSGLNPGGFLAFRWVIVAAPLLVLGGLAFVPFLLSLPRTIAWRIVLAGTVYVGGAYGVELIGGYLSETRGQASHAFIAAVIVEESMEMIGLTLFIIVLIELLVRQSRTLTLRFD